MKKLYYLIVLALILGLVLTGCLLSNVGQVPTINQSGITYLTKNTVTALFSDDFESYDTGPLVSVDWQNVSGTSSIVSDTIDATETQVLGIVGGSYVGEAVAVTGSSSWQDYSLDLDVKKHSGSYFNIVFRYVNSENYYLIEPSADKIHIALFRRVGGAFTELASRPSQATVIGTWYHYRIELWTTPNGTNIKVFVNGTKKFDVIDNTPALTTGSVGVGGYAGSEGRFDNVVVQSLYVGFKGLLHPYAPPGQKAFKVGRTIPLKWQYTDSDDNVVDSANANPIVECILTDDENGSGILDEEEDAPGASGLHYDSSTFTWIFNWQTKDWDVGTYNITITSGQAKSSDIFPIELRK